LLCLSFAAYREPLGRCLLRFFPSPFDRPDPARIGANRGQAEDVAEVVIQAAVLKGQAGKDRGDELGLLGAMISAKTGERRNTVLRKDSGADLHPLIGFGGHHLRACNQVGFEPP